VGIQIIRRRFHAELLQRNFQLLIIRGYAVPLWLPIMKSTPKPIGVHENEHGCPGRELASLLQRGQQAVEVVAVVVHAPAEGFELSA
jgi:hypothetical protein